MYIKYFTKVAKEIGCCKKSLNCWIFENGLKHDSFFRDKLGRKEALCLKYLLNRDQPFFNLEGKIITQGDSQASTHAGFGRSSMMDSNRCSE